MLKMGQPSDGFARTAIVLLLVILGLWVGYDYLQLALHTQTEPRAVTARGDLSAMEETAVSVFERTAPSVVFVTTVERTRSSVFGGGPARVGTGSGFVWDKAGHIVTNDHVVAGADQVGVRFGAGDLLRAEIIGSAPDYDLAVLRVRGANRTYQPVPLGSSAGLRVGQTVFAIGNPYGLSRTLTQGLVSAVERRLPTSGGREVRGVIQTDAAINPGNSGGPLLDSAGRLIGVNTAIISGSGSFAGIGFAVPVDIVNRVVSTLIREGEVPRPGIGIIALSETMAARLDVDGVVIADVMPGSPAAGANLQGLDARAGRLGDVITHANGKRVHSVADLAVQLQEVGVGNEATLRVTRHGQSRTVRLPVVDMGAIAAGAE